MTIAKNDKKQKTAKSSHSLKKPTVTADDLAKEFESMNFLTEKEKELIKKHKRKLIICKKLVNNLVGLSDEVNMDIKKKDKIINMICKFNDANFNQFYEIYEKMMEKNCCTHTLYGISISQICCVYSTLGFKITCQTLRLSGSCTINFSCKKNSGEILRIKM